MPIVTLKGMTKPLNALYVKYDGVFISGHSYGFNTNDYVGVDNVSVIYMSSVRNYTGVLDRGFSETDCASNGTITIKYAGVTYTYTPHYNEVIIPFVIEDNNGEFIIGFRNFRLAYSLIRIDSSPTAEKYGSGTIIHDPYVATTHENYNPTISGLVNLWMKIPTYPDPYSPGSETEKGGGEGDFDNTSDPIPEASLPTLSAVDAKFISLYTPTLAELQSLASYMWSPLFDLDTLKKIFADPMKAILGLSILPIAVPSSGQQTVTIGNISTGVSMTKASAQYIQIDCGTLNVNEYWGAYLDYSPYTKLEIYLPYIGTKQISIDDVMNKACHVYYNVDILTGACCAMIKCDDSVLYSYAGQCATSIPITGNDWTNVVSGALSTALSVVGVAAGAVTGSAPLTGASAIGLVSSASQNVMQMKPIIEKSGSLGGSAGMLGVQSPYLILTRPRQALPKDQNRFTGYPSYANMKLGDLAGMTFVEQVHLENVPCTSLEQSEIETLLKGGVIF